jgi:hypothetical protein
MIARATVPPKTVYIEISVWGKILPARRRADGLHVACAIPHGIELVVSWNYRHIANHFKADAFRAVALPAGWPAKFEIHTPFEVLRWN